jgi:hypothetical protein
MKKKVLRERRKAITPEEIGKAMQPLVEVVLTNKKYAKPRKVKQTGDK